MSYLYMISQNPSNYAKDLSTSVTTENKHHMRMVAQESDISKMVSSYAMGCLAARLLSLTFYSLLCLSSSSAHITAT
jgi:hypothetical protein